MVYLREPVTRKESEDGCGGPVDAKLRYGVTGMQGWRRNMEDMHLAATELDDGLALFGVFDGHMGRGVSRFAAQRLPQILKETEAYKQGDYVKALERAFLSIDEILREAESRRAVEELDRADRDAPSEPVVVPRRLLQRFLGRRGLKASRDGDEDESETVVGVSGGDAPPEATAKVAAAEGGDGGSRAGESPAVAPEEPPAAARSGVPAAEELPSEEPELPSEEEDLEAQLHDISDAEEGEEEGDEFSLVDDEVEIELDGFVDGEEDFENEEMALVDPAELTRDPTPEGQGCTAVVVLVVRRPEGEGPRLICANAGDSRAILSRNGTVVALSEDHKPENDIELARIKKAGGFVQNMRVQGDLNLSRAFGDLRYKIPANFPPEEQVLTCFPEVKTFPLSDEDEFLVIGCDGIWERKENQEMIDFVRPRLAKAGEAPKLSKICEEICDDGLCQSMDSNQNEGFDGTGCDNMTVVIVQLKATVGAVGANAGANGEAAAAAAGADAAGEAGAAAAAAASGAAAGDAVAGDATEPPEKRPRTEPLAGDVGPSA